MSDIYSYRAKKSKLTIIALLLILLGLTYNFIYKNHKQGTLNIKKDIVLSLQKEYSITANVYSELANIIFHFSINREEITSIFYKGVTASNEEIKDQYRKELYKKLEGMYLDITKYNFRQLHFHTKDNTSFLRFHSPEKYGDDLTNIRYSVEYVNREMKPISGFEEGYLVNGYRFVFPINYNNEHIGSVEISISLKAIMNQLEVPAQLIMDRDIVNAKVLDSGKLNYIPWELSPKYMLDREVSTNSNLIITLDKKEKSKIDLALIDSKKSKEESIVTIKNQNIEKLIILLPIINFTDDVVSFLIFYTESEDLAFHKISFMILTMTFLLLFVIILSYATYYSLSQKKMSILANTDYLTKTDMRRKIIEKIDLEISRFTRYKTTFSIIMLDIDHFKLVNDNYGHKIGDIILKEVTRLIMDSIRSTDSVGRYGGEEFIILFPETKLEDAIIAAENIRITVEKFKFNQMKKVTVSCGIKEYNHDSGDSKDIIDLADKKLYIAKESGRNKVIG